MKFDYQGRTKEGEIRAGRVEASSKEAVVAILQKNGLYVTFLEESSSPFYAKGMNFLQRISSKDLVIFSRQLAIMFKSEIPLVESLRTLGSQVKKTELKDKILEISEEVEGGASFSLALARFPEIFSPFFIAMVKTGEVSGKLSETLNYLAGHLEREYYLNSKTKSAMIYPAMIVLVAFVVLLIMNSFVIPQMSQVLLSAEGEVPSSTMLLLNASAFLRKWGWVPILFLAIMGFLAYRYYLTEKGRKIFDKYILKIPVIGPFVKLSCLTRFAENLSTLISGGLPISQALTVVADIVGNVAYKEIILKTREKVGAGESISSVLVQYPDLFEPIFIQMILVGEKTGTVERTLMDLVVFYQKEIDTATVNIMALLEPTLIIFLGVVVGGMILAILMPMYQMMTI
ncbi:MAG: type II secretion system F family protein [Candidatus Nealsonbacteria bacterium]|nr:type II secretion system F family protein [Candidatus Nealsonbacteria bacterium]